MSTSPNEASISLTLRVLVYCYSILTLFFAFAFIDSTLAVQAGADVHAYMEDIISFPVYLLIIVGMKRRRPWVRPLVYGVACFSTLRMLSVMISGDMTAAAVNGLAAFLMYLFNGMFIFFFAYQLYFFSRADVRAYYEKPLDK